MSKRVTKITLNNLSIETLKRMETEIKEHMFKATELNEMETLMQEVKLVRIEIENKEKGDN